MALKGVVISMAFDAGMLYAVLHEIKEACLGARVEKVYEPTRDEIILLLRGKRLSINIGSMCPRIALTRLSKDNPQTPPMFCMLLRKHLSGAALTGIEQCGFDRVAKLSFAGYDEMGYPTEKKLYAELMGKYSNLILTDQSDKIIAVAKPIDFSDSDIRQLLPNISYILPPVPEKANPLFCDKESFEKAFAAANGDKSAAGTLTSSFTGTASLVAKEIVFRAYGKTDTLVRECSADVLWKAFEEWFKALKEYRIEPTVVRDEKGDAVFYGYREIRHKENSTLESFSSLSELFDNFFGERDRIERIRSRAADLVRLVTHTEARLRKKLILQREELASSEKSEDYRRMGDLITGEIYRIKRGMTSFDAVDYTTEEPSTVKVELDSRLSPSQNAQKYYKLYSKAKKAREVLATQLELTEKELAYIESVSAFLSRAETEVDLAEIRDELYRSGYAARMKKYTPQKQVKARPMEFTTSSGYKVLCGRNNLQNELLTFRVASKGDLWFHAKDIPGSHVILLCDGEEPSEKDYTEAAEIAARYSSASADVVAVDYTRVKNVKKPPAAKPGYVIYKTNYTAYVKINR